MRTLCGAALVILTLVAGCTAGTPSTREPARLALSSVPQRTGILVVPVVPVGGDIPGGRQTRASAIAQVDSIAATAAGGIDVTADLRWLCQAHACDTAALDPVVEHARKRGLRVYVHVNSSPSWMAPRGRWFAPLGDDATVWAGLFAQLVARYGTGVSGYEVWNEPNLREFWQQGPDPEAYADLLRAVWTAVRSVEPHAVLIGGVLSNNDLGYMAHLDKALKAKGGTRANGFYYDLLSVHPYAGGDGYGLSPSAAPNSATARTAFGVKDMTFLGIDRLRDQVARDEGIPRDVVISEFGYDTERGSWYHVSEPERAGFLAEALTLARSRSWVRSFVPYSYTQGADGGFGIRGTPSEFALRDTAAAGR